jgi:hypothetical protein
MYAVAKKGTLPSATPVIIPVGVVEPPMSITLKSAAVGRKIELSTDGGTEYFTPTVDQTSATMQVVSVLAPVSHIKLTGTTNDTYTVI